MPKYTVEVRNAAYERIGILEQYTSLDAIIRYCDVGSWTLTVDATQRDADLLKPGGGVIVWLEGLPDPLFSGPLTKVGKKWDASLPAGLITFSGKTDESFLWQRITFPLPANDIGTQTKDRYDGSSTVGAALSALVNLNIGPGSRSERRHPNMVVESSTAGPTIALSSRFDVLGDYLKQIALPNGLGFSLIQEADSTNIFFDVFQPTDRSDTIIFSPDVGNMESYSYTLTAPEATWIAVASQGEGVARYIKPFFSIGAEVVNNLDSRIVYTGAGWALASGRGGGYNLDVQYTPTLGASAEMTFIGTGVEYVAETFSDQGYVEVYIDGITQGLIDTSSVTRQYQVTLFSKLDLPYGIHTIKITKRTGGVNMLLDAFRVFATPAGVDWNSFNPERFVDRRDLPIKRSALGAPVHPDTNAAVTADVLNQLSQAGIEGVLEGSSTASLSVTPIDTDLMKFGIHYKLGDIVSVSIDGESIKDVLREVHLSDTAEEGPRVRPVVGTEGASETPGIYREIRRLWGSLRKLEARR